MAALSGSLNLGKSAITKTVDRLEERGLLTRTREPADRRAVFATLTDEGADLFRRAQPAFAAEVAEVMRPLTRSDLAALRAGLRALRGRR